MGRSTRAALRLSEGYVSSEHALIRWSGSAWELRDLGSRNGTFVDGAPVDSRSVVRLRKGTVLGFGHREQSWQLIEDSPPTAMAIPLEEPASALCAVDDMLALPSVEQPVATLFRGLDGSWLLESAEATAVLRHHKTFEVNGIHYRFSCPEAAAATAATDGGAFASRGVRDAQLHFHVSRDEEHVELHVAFGGKVVPLGSRGHNYLLLILARQYLADRSRDLAATECGWIYQEELTQGLRVTQERLNIDVFRIRKQIASVGLANAADIIERRHSTRQLRIGTALIELAPR